MLAPQDPRLKALLEISRLDKVQIHNDTATIPMSPTQPLILSRFWSLEIPHLCLSPIHICSYCTLFRLLRLPISIDPSTLG